MTKHSPFRYFKTSPDIIRLAVMLYVRFPLSLRNVEDLIHERGVDLSHETVRFWWNPLGPMFKSTHLQPDDRTWQAQFLAHRLKSVSGRARSDLKLIRATWPYLAVLYADISSIGVGLPDVSYPW